MSSEWYSSPRPLSITTRGVGINLCNFYHHAASSYYSYRREDQFPDIYAVYRALLAIVESKILRSMPYYGSEAYKYDYKLLGYVHDGPFWLPVTLKNLVQAIGEINCGGVSYLPAVSKDTEIDGVFVPRPENILLSNLRKTLDALANTAVDINHRKNFYKNNPIPGAIWQDDYTLSNIEEIMPNEYDFDNDLHEDLHVLQRLNWIRRYQNFERVDIQQKGKFSCLMTCDMGDLRVPDRQSAHTTLMSYYMAALPEKDITEFFSKISLRKNQTLEGATILLGERPNYENWQLNPIYHQRLEGSTPFQARNAILLEESKFTLAQQRQSALKLRESNERQPEYQHQVRMPAVRPRTSRRRSLSAIRESGVFDTDRYRPLKRGEDREKMKEKLANIMAFGDNKEEQAAQVSLPNIKKSQPKLPTNKEKWHDLVTQIRERTEWLAEMEYLGQAGPHREIIKDQIAERMRALDALGIDSQCSTPKSVDSGFSTTSLHCPSAPQKISPAPSNRSRNSVKRQSIRSTARNRTKDENVSAYSQLSPLQYSPRRRM